MLEMLILSGKKILCLVSAESNYDLSLKPQRDGTTKINNGNVA